MGMAASGRNSIKEKKGKHGNPLNFSAAEAMIFSIAADFDEVFSVKRRN